MADDFEWPDPESEDDEAFISKVREHGCMIIDIPWDARGPGYSFSVGLSANYGHPELIIFGLAPDDAHAIINDVRDRVAVGRRFVDGDLSDEFLEDGYKVCFWQVPLMAYRDYLGTALWFYGKSERPFPCLQIIWPDRNRKFPWEAGCIPEVKEDQPLLKKTVS